MTTKMRHNHLNEYCTTGVPLISFCSATLTIRLSIPRMLILQCKVLDRRSEQAAQIYEL